MGPGRYSGVEVSDHSFYAYRFRNGRIVSWRSYEAFDTEPEEVLDMGGGITFVVVRHRGRVLGAAGRVEERVAWAIAWEQRLAVHIVGGMDIDAVRAAAERLAEERR